MCYVFELLNFESLLYFGGHLHFLMCFIYLIFIKNELYWREDNIFILLFAGMFGDVMCIITSIVLCIFVLICVCLLRIHFSFS
jgi:hypothetical protein